MKDDVLREFAFREPSYVTLEPKDLLFAGSHPAAGNEHERHTHETEVVFQTVSGQPFAQKRNPSAIAPAHMSCPHPLPGRFRLGLT